MRQAGRQTGRQADRQTDKTAPAAAAAAAAAAARAAFREAPASDEIDGVCHMEEGGNPISRCMPVAASVPFAAPDSRLVAADDDDIDGDGDDASKESGFFLKGSFDPSFMKVALARARPCASERGRVGEKGGASEREMLHVTCYRQHFMYVSGYMKCFHVT
jgi:hypothetical protein